MLLRLFCSLDQHTSVWRLALTFQSTSHQCSELYIVIQQVIAGVDVLALDNDGQTAAGIAAARGLSRVSEVPQCHGFFFGFLPIMSANISN
jgi:hypothetical protein